MMLREFSLHRSVKQSFCLGFVLIVFLFPSVLLADSAGSDVIATESPWSDDLPQIETRISWAWPDFLTPKSPIFAREDAKSVPLSRRRRPLAKLFEKINWLADPRYQGAIADSEAIVIRADNGWVGSPGIPDLISSPNAQVTLVRGGQPQLFGARGRLRAEYGDEFDEVKRIRGQLLLNLIGNHIGIDASVNSWEDNRPRAKALGDFWTGDANLVYSMGAQRVSMRGGAGASWVYDEELDVGYNTTYGADLFLTRPWLISGEIDYGKINQEKLFHWRATFGVQLMRMEVYLGYDSYKWSHIRFDGPVAGAGLWF